MTLVSDVFQIWKVSSVVRYFSRELPAITFKSGASFHVGLDVAGLSEATSLRMVLCAAIDPASLVCWATTPLMWQRLLRRCVPLRRCC